MFLRRLRVRTLSPRSPFQTNPAALSSWSPAGDLQHIYAVKEFERQVYGRLGTIDNVERMNEYSCDAQAREGIESFLDSFPKPEGFKWGKHHNPKNNKTRDTAQEVTVECDLYLRCGSPTHLADVFKDCADEVVLLSSASGAWNDTTTTDAQPVLLCEVAETPESLRNKLWQLERAVCSGPDDFRAPAACVVCLNGEKAKFTAATTAVQQALQSDKGKMLSISKLPLYAIWTPYRNTYAEVKELHVEVKELKTDMKELKTDMTELKKDFGELEAKLDVGIAAILDKLAR